MEEFSEYLRVDDWLHTSGQPTSCQLETLHEHNIVHVINLALPTSDNAIQNEAAVVCNQGINYLNVPVDFKNPTEKQFGIFCAYLNQVRGDQTLVHCAYNMRVSAFVYLYRVLHLGVPKAEAEVALHKLWVPFNEWELFVNNMLKMDMAP